MQIFKGDISYTATVVVDNDTDVWVLPLAKSNQTIWKIVNLQVIKI